MFSSYIYLIPGFKHFTTVICTMCITLSVLATSCGRADMYEFATGEHPVLYAVTDTDDGLYTAIIKYADLEQYTEYATGISSGTASRIDAPGDGTVFLYDPSTSYIINPGGAELTVATPITVTAAASDGYEEFIFSSSVNDVYRFDRNSSAWVLYKTLSVAYPPYLVSTDPLDDRIYFMYCVGGGSDLSIFDLDTETLQIPSFGPGPGINFFMSRGGYFYNSKQNVAAGMNIRQNGTVTVYLAGVESVDITINSRGEIFTASVSPNLAIYRSEGAVFVLQHSFLSTTGNMVLRYLKEGKLAVGISGSNASEDGLYVYDYKSDSLERLTSKPVYLMTSR